MEKITQKELNKILIEHGKYLLDFQKGCRANFSGYNLNIYWAILNFRIFK